MTMQSDEALRTAQAYADAQAARSNGASIPLTITHTQRARLMAMGHTEAQINAMKPSEAHTILGIGDPPPAPAVNSNGNGYGKTADNAPQVVATKTAEKKDPKKKKTLITRDVIRQIADQIKDKLSIDRVIQKYGGADLKGDDKKLIGHHRAHESTSKTSLCVDVDQGLWHCFNCKWGGDHFDWVGRLRHGHSWNNADMGQFVPVLRDLAQEAGVPIPEEELTEEEIQAAADRRSIEEIYRLAAEFYHNELDDKRRQYFHTRGFSDAIIDRLRLGWAPAHKLALFTWLRKQHKIPAADLLKTGLFKKWGNGSYEDFFQGRYIFPYFNRGRVVYFIGRETDESPAWEKEAQGMKTRSCRSTTKSTPTSARQ